MTITLNPEVGAEQATRITTLQLNRLMLSGLNVRKTERDADIAALADDIAARGLKQNLVVIPAHFSTGDPAAAHLNGEPAKSGGKAVWKDRFEVIAGGRRFQAMQLLVEDGRLPADHAVPVLIEDRDAASETSLSENLHRVAMNPADEFDAFRTIVLDWMKIHAHAAWLSGGASDCPPAIEYCAKRFGKTPSYVAGRLRLAALAPEILTALRENKLGLESAKAYAGTTDHAAQLKVFKDQCKSSWKPHDPQTVRQQLRGETVAIDHGLVKFVGLDAYLAAGGRTETEMFMGADGAERVTDLKLLNKLATEKAEPLVTPQAKKDGFKEGLLAKGLGHNATWPKAPAGMERYYAYYGTEPTKAQLKKSVAVYAIDFTGEGISRVGFYKPPTPAKVGPNENEVRWAEEARNRKIYAIAARKAAGFKAKGTALEGNAFWPLHGISPVEGDRGSDEHVLVALQIRVPVADIDAHMAEAERQYDEELAAAEHEKAAKAAAQEAVDSKLDDPDAGDDDLDGEFDDGEHEGVEQ